MTKPPIHDLTIYKNSDRSIIINVLGVSGSEPLIGDTLEFFVYEYVGSDAVITKTTALATEIAITGSSEATVYFLPADTLNLEAKRYIYELWHTDSVTAHRVPALIGFFDVLVFRSIEVEILRGRLQEAGEDHLIFVEDEQQVSVGTDQVYLHHRRIEIVSGIWLGTDNSKSGTNFFTGGSVNIYSGKTILGTPTSANNTVLRCDYVWKSGLADEQIFDQLEKSRIFVEGWTGVKFNYGAANTDLKKQAEQMALARTTLTAIMMINGANAAQLGYNFRIHEFEIQSKLWGEGMIAQSLFALYKEEYMEWMQILGKKIGFEFMNIRVNGSYYLKDALNFLGRHNR